MSNNNNIAKFFSETSYQDSLIYIKSISCTYISGVKYHYFHGSDSSSHICKCYEDNVCPMTSCNCNGFGSAQDQGIIKNKDHLPLTAIHYGPLNTGEGSVMKIQVGDLKCSGIHPPVDCKWGEFTPSSECSKTCGNGVQSVTRVVIQESRNGGSECVGEATKQEICNVQQCPVEMGNIILHTYVN